MVISAGETPATTRLFLRVRHPPLHAQSQIGGSRAPSRDKEQAGCRPAHIERRSARSTLSRVVRRFRNRSRLSSANTLKTTPTGARIRRTPSPLENTLFLPG